MSKNAEKKDTYRLYDRQTKTWFEVTPEQYAEIDRWRTNLRKREQYHHRCMCTRNKWWLCDGMCLDCQFHAAGNILSLDAVQEDEQGEEFSLLDTIADKSLDLSGLPDSMLAKQILKEIEELMPEALKIGSFRLQGMTDEAIAREIGISRTTYRSRIDKVRKVLRKKYGNDFDF